jgi:hypothetical protein
MSTDAIGVGTSASWKIFFAPDFVLNREFFYGSPLMIGTFSLIESFMSSEPTTPGTIYACLPFIIDFILLKTFGLYISTYARLKWLGNFSIFSGTKNCTLSLSDYDKPAISKIFI